MSFDIRSGPWRRRPAPHLPDSENWYRYYIHIATFNVQMSGYSKLAAFMTEKHHPILKKYRHLAARDLLYLQAELSDLQFRYDETAKKDATAKDRERENYHRDWLNMATSQQRGFGGEQWVIAIATRNKLREYCAFTNVPSGAPRRDWN